MRAIGTLGSALGRFDTSGLAYVTEDGNHRLSVFNLEGQFVQALGTLGRALGQFYYPHGVVL